MSPERAVELRRMVHRHLVACAEEGKRDFADCAVTPAGAGLVALYEIVRQAAFSFGCTMSSSGQPSEPLRSEVFAEVAIAFDDGFSHPGEGHLL